jgi:hypothetical protein
LAPAIGAGQVPGDGVTALALTCVQALVGAPNIRQEKSTLAGLAGLVAVRVTRRWLVTRWVEAGLVTVPVASTTSPVVAFQ